MITHVHRASGGVGRLHTCRNGCKLGEEAPRAVKVPEPVAALFRRMADEGPGTLSVVSVGPSGLVRMRYKAEPGMLERGVVRNFSVRAVPGPGLVEVRTIGQPPVLVSPVPSAVLAVALR